MVLIGSRDWITWGFMPWGHCMDSGFYSEWDAEQCPPRSMMPPPNHWNLGIDYFAWWRDFADAVSQVEMGDYPGLAHWAQCNCEVPTKREAGETGTAVEDVMRNQEAGLRHGRDHELRNVGASRGWKSKDKDFPWSIQKECRDSVLFQVVIMVRVWVCFRGKINRNWWWLDEGERAKSKLSC